MQYSVKPYLILLWLISLSLIPDSFKYNTPNNSGTVGLINLPTARFLDESASALTVYRGDPDRKITMTLMPYDWFEGSFFYTSIKGKTYPGYSQDYKDKGFNLKFRLKKEGNFPALAIGLNDFAGTGVYGSEYFVSSYGINNLDFHLGIGWGRLSGDKNQISNPLKQISESFGERDSNTGVGGELRIGDYFSGNSAALFGGISYLLNDNILIKAEFDPTFMPKETTFPDREHNASFSIEYLYKDNLVFSLSHERGDYLGFKFSYRSNGKKYEPNQFVDSGSRNILSYQRLKDILENNNIGVLEISEEKNRAFIEITEFSYASKERLDLNLKSAIKKSDFNYEEVLISYKTAGLQGSMPEEIKEFKNKNTLLNQYIMQQLTFNHGFVLRPFLASREDFFKGALLYELDSEYIFSENFFWTTNFKYSLIGNLDDLVIPPKDTYPNQVRSDIKDYLRNFDNGINIGRSQFDFFNTLIPNHHLQISAGIFEEMFSGYGFEYLWNNNKSPIALGVESFKVYKRDYKGRFGLNGYNNQTSHVNLFFDNKKLIPFTLHISYGEYLAGDIGYTFDLSRSFSNGIIMGGFFTRTDVTKRQFGEGSFDKGIYFKIPIFNNELFNYYWRPLTKDPGAKLTRKNNIYQLTKKYRR